MSGRRENRGALFSDTIEMGGLMKKTVITILCAITVLAALTQAIAFASEEGSDENVGVIVVRERQTENGLEVTLVPENSYNGLGEFDWRQQ